MSAKTTGKLAEQLAGDYLIKQGLKLVDRNYSCRRGEIDLIMVENKTLVFVEVRYRRSSQFGGAIESVNREKMSRIITTAEHYLQQHPRPYKQYRFDVIAMQAIDIPDIIWIKDAFQVN